MSRRATALLDLARKYGHDIEASAHVEGCWTIRAPGGRPGDPSLTVYAEPRDAAVVMYDRAGGATWEQITQADARTILVNRSLGPQRLWIDRQRFQSTDSEGE